MGVETLVVFAKARLHKAFFFFMKRANFVKQLLSPLCQVWGTLFGRLGFSVPVYRHLAYVIWCSSFGPYMRFVPQVCLPLTNSLKVIHQSTRGKIKPEQGGDMRFLRNVITIHTGAPALGRTLPSWSAMRRPWIWWRSMLTALNMATNVSLAWVYSS